MGYDSNNIFAKILRGELPAQKVYEDADTLAFMDIMPRCEGHMLVIPKTPARNVLDASPTQLAACMRTVQKVSAAAMKAFGAAGITIQQFIIIHKIEKVKELLLYDELNLTEISYKLHYSSVAHLCTQFKKITGLTPSHFKGLKDKRRSMLEDL